MLALDGSARRYGERRASAADRWRATPSALRVGGAGYQDRDYRSANLDSVHAGNHFQ
jgi:hypothetical protein